MSPIGRSIGTIFVELDLDSSKYTAGQRRIINEARQTSLSVEKNWNILGSKSNLMFDAMRQRVMNAYEMITKSGKSSAEEIVRAEKHKNEAIQRINDEQFGNLKNHMRQVKIGWMDMVKGAIVFRTVMAGLHAVYSAFVDIPRKGIKAIDDLKTAQASMAAAFATNDISLPFDRAYRIAGGMVEKIQELDRAFIGTADELMMLADSMATFGAGIDLSTAKAQKEFVTFGNLIKLMTRGQDFQRQAYQEVRSLMEGQNVQGALLVKKLEAMGVNVKTMIPLWREQGTILENINKYLTGYAETGAKIEHTIEAQKSSLNTIVTKILRGGMGPAYEDIVGWLMQINDYLLDENGLTEEGLKIVGFIQRKWEGIKSAILGVAEAIGTVTEALEESRTKTQEWGNVIDKWTEKIKKALGGWPSGRRWPKGLADVFNLPSEIEFGLPPEYLRGLMSGMEDEMFPELLKTKGTKGKGKSEAEKIKKEIIDSYDALIISADDYYGTLEDRSLEFTNFQIEQTVERAKWNDQFMKNDLGAYLEYVDAETKALLEENDKRIKDYEDTVKKQKEIHEELKDWVIHGFDDMANKVAEFGLTGKFAFKDFVKSAIGDLLRLVTKMQLLRGFESLVGGTSLGDFLGFKVEKKASGGDVFRGRPYIVGEQGPELFVPKFSGSIVPSVAMGAGRGDINVEVQVINQTGQQVNAESMPPRFDGDRYILGVVLKGLENNTMGIRHALGGA